MNRRDAKILEKMTREHRMEVARLAELMGVSQVTMRKDLDALEARGLIKREHGYAILGSLDDIGNRLAFHYEVKRRIAHRAASLVRDGETVMIESGSSCALLAETLTRQRHGVTIVTNSAFIAGYVRKNPGARVVLLGGDYQNESQCTVGAIARACAQNFFVDKLFVGTDGFSQRTGFTGNDHARAETVRDMAAQANGVVVLTESSKFGRQGVVSLLPAQAVGTLITDAAIPKESETYLAENGVEVLKVEADA